MDEQREKEREGGRIEQTGDRGVLPTKTNSTTIMKKLCIIMCTFPRYLYGVWMEVVVMLSTKEI